MHHRDILAFATVLCVGCYSGLSVEQTAAGGASDGSADSVGDDDDDPAELCVADAGKTRLRRLTREQYDNAVTDLIGLEGDWAAGLEFDERIGPFASNYTAPISESLLSQYVQAAELVAESAAGELDAWVPCDSSDPSCGRDLVHRLGRRALRRPLTQAEAAPLEQLIAGAEDFESGALLVLRALLQSPYFLYHVEVASTGVAELTPFELASRLSFFLWNSIPDDELLDLADADALDDATLELQARRMLDDPKAQRTLVSFHRQWLDLQELEHLEKDTSMFPDFDSLRASMHADLESFVRHVFTQDDARIETLLTASYGFPDERLAAVYGVELPAGHVPGERVELDPRQRAGLLTLPAFLAVHAHSTHSAPIKRGVTVRSNILCTPPPPPPPAAVIEPPDPDPDSTTREIFEEHTSNPECAGCHVLIDGLGLGFEGYDAIGAYRTEENGLPVDESGELGAADVGGPYVGVPELAAMLATSGDVRGCMVRQWFRYSVGRFELAEDECTIEALDRVFESENHDIRALLLAITKSDAFRRKRFAEEDSP